MDRYFLIPTYSYNIPMSTKPLIETSPNPSEQAGKHINDLLSTHIDKPVLLMLGGGSALDVLPFIKPEYLSPEVTVTVTDERFTDDMGENNFDVLQTTEFYQNLMSADAYCINTSVVGGEIAYEEYGASEGAAIHAERFETHIRNWMQDFEKTGIIIGLFGMGADGHVAGIIPGIYDDEEFDKKFLGDRDVAVIEIDEAHRAPNEEFQFRVTTTLSFIKKIHHPIFHIKGENKHDALIKALNPETKLSDIPARVILDIQNPTIFTNISL
jgi:6-phosphogluconolactonase/glucosamine-6-phosphate isomerase/deaminase